MARIVLDGVTKVFGSDVVAVDDVSLEMPDGEPHPVLRAGRRPNQGAPGARVTLSLDPERFHYFDKDTGMRLGEAGVHPTVPADLALQSPRSTP